MITDLTPARNKNRPARLLDRVEGRSKAVFKQRLKARPQAWPPGIEVVAMDGFTGFKTAAAEGLPDATPVMDGFHIVRLASDALDRTRQRVQQTPQGIAAESVIRSTRRAARSVRVSACSPRNNEPGSRQCSPPGSTSRSKRPGVSLSVT